MILLWFLMTLCTTTNAMNIEHLKQSLKTLNTVLQDIIHELPKASKPIKHPTMGQNTLVISFELPPEVINVIKSVDPQVKIAPKIPLALYENISHELRVNLTRAFENLIQEKNIYIREFKLDNISNHLNGILTVGSGLRTLENMRLSFDALNISDRDWQSGLLLHNLHIATMQSQPMQADIKKLYTRVPLEKKFIKTFYINDSKIEK